LRAIPQTWSWASRSSHTGSRSVRSCILQDAYGLASRADDVLNAGRHDEAARLYVEASECAPDNHELMFWAGLGTARAADLEGGAAKVRDAIALRPTWRGP
jgi:hypothetical protein